MGKRNSFLSIFFFAALMLIKVCAFHVFTHQDADEDSIEHCSICDFATENQQMEFSANSETSLVQKPLNTFNTLEIGYDNLFFDTSLPDCTLFSRPPPFLG